MLCRIKGDFLELHANTYSLFTLCCSVCWVECVFYLVWCVCIFSWVFTSGFIADTTAQHMLSHILLGCVHKVWLCEQIMFCPARPVGTHAHTITSCIGMLLVWYSIEAIDSFVWPTWCFLCVFKWNWLLIFKRERFHTKPDHYFLIYK